jgi:hypothetical protein
MGALVTSEPLAGVDTHFGRSERPHIGMSARFTVCGRSGRAELLVGIPAGVRRKSGLVAVLGG